MTPTEVFQHYTDAWNRHDPAGIVATFAEGGTYTDPTTAGPLAGAAIAAYAQSLWDAFPDLSFETVSLTHNDQGLVSAEWLMKGTNTGPMMGLPPTGRSIALSGADFARIEGGKILSLRGYFDGRAVPRALGLDIIVQPSSIGPFGFGTSIRASNGSTALPGAFSITNFFARNVEEVAIIQEGGRKIAIDMLSMPGFISMVSAVVGDCLIYHHRLGNPGFYGALDEAGRTSFYGQPLLYLGIRARRNDRSVGSTAPQSTPRPLSWL